MHPMLIVAGVGTLLLLLAWGLWAIVRHWDRKNAVVQAAAPLPIRLVNVWDKVWIRGEIESDEPRAVPHFGYGCVHYTYKLEEEKRTTQRGSDGRTRTKTHWVTRDTKNAAARFRVRQGDHALLVHAEKAEWLYEHTETETVGDLRHTCTYVPSHGPISVVGVVGETKETLEPLANVPLIVTPAERRPYIEQVETEERRVARLGLILLFLGGALLVYGLGRKAQVPHPDPRARFWENLPASRRVEWWDVETALLAAGLGLFPTLLFGSIRIYNNLVVYRTRAEMSWSQVDVLLKQRYDLIPRLVQVVQGYASHEQKALEELTALRGRAEAGDRSVRVASEPGAVDGMTRMLVLAEAYPDLKSDSLFRQLAGQATALEDKIAHARGFFNDAVAEFNTHAAVFPSNLIAGAFSFAPLPLFAAELQERAVPRLV